jgi:repressor LexA
MPEPLTKIERRILNYLVDYLKENTYQPSIREIGKRFGIKSTKTVSEHLQSLAEKGHIERDASRSRGVKILGMNLAPSVFSIPFYGKIAPGKPALQREHVREEYDVDRRFAPSADAFFVGVSGDGSAALGVHAGDLVLVEPVDAADLRDADVVALRAGEEAIVRRGTPDGSGAEVLGRVVGLFRRFAAAPAPALADLIGA